MQSIRSHLRATLSLAIPVAIGQLGHVMLGVVDSIMVGKLGAVPLAAASLVNSLFFLLFVTGIGISMAITPLVAIAHGGNSPERCGEVLRHGLLVNVGSALIFAALGFVLAKSVWYLNQPFAVAAEAASYMTIMSMCYLPMMIFHGVRQFVEGLGFTRPPMYIVLVANGVNVLGNWLLIYGNLGFPMLGLDGAGYSSLITETVMTIVLLVYAFRSKRCSQYRPSFSFRNIDRSFIRRLLGIGLPSGAQMLFEVSAFSFSAIMIGWTGSVSLAAHQVGISLASLSFMIILGISIAATIRVGNALGSDELQEVRRAGFLAIVLGASIMACFGCLFLVFRRQLPYFYISDPQVLPIASTLLVIAAIFQIMDGIQAVGMGALRGITDVKIPMLISFFAYWVIAIPVGYNVGIVNGYGAPGVWMGFVCGLGTAATSFALRFHFKTKRMLKTANR